MESEKNGVSKGSLDFDLSLPLSQDTLLYMPIFHPCARDPMPAEPAAFWSASAAAAAPAWSLRTPKSEVVHLGGAVTSPAMHLS